jgi:hypothetical protein
MPRKNPAAVALGRLGGKVKSVAKTLAARANAKKKRSRTMKTVMILTALLLTGCDIRNAHLSDGTTKPVIERLGPYLTTEEARSIDPAWRKRSIDPVRRERLGPAPNLNPLEFAISEKKIMIGMTPQHVLRAWGRPLRINESVGANYHHEQWVYAASQYIYFQNGVLTSWQTTRE